jgi:hypothetical protein
VRFELAPLRGAAGSPLGDTPSSAPREESVPPRPHAPAADDPRSQIREGFLSSLPVLVLPADSAWLAGKHKGSHWDTLFVMQDRLRARNLGDAAALDPQTWRKLQSRLDDLHIFWCIDERPRKHSFGSEPCAYLKRGVALAEARAAALAAKPLTRNTRVYLQGLSSSRDARVSSWARQVLARVPAGPPSGLPGVPPAPSPTSGSQGDRPGN